MGIKFKLDFTADPELDDTNVCGMEGEFAPGVTSAVLISVIMALEQATVPLGDLAEEHLIFMAGQSPAEDKIFVALNGLVELAKDLHTMKTPQARSILRRYESDLRGAIADFALERMGDGLKV